MQYPKLSIIVPSYNQGEYLEETLLSIINQSYCNLELIVIDGGSMDNSVEIIKKYEKNISYWTSEKDRGQSHAINKGLQKATGEWIGWLNSDDCYLEGALNYIFSNIDVAKYDFLYGGAFIGASIVSAESRVYRPEYKKGLKEILQFFYNVYHIIPSQSVFVRKSIVDIVGLLDENLHYCMDFDWFCRIYIATEKRLDYQEAISFFRMNQFTKTATNGLKMQFEAIAVAERYLGYVSKTDQTELKRLIKFYKQLYAVMQSSKISFIKLLSIALRFPLRFYKDTTYKILVKKSLQLIK